ENHRQLESDELATMRQVFEASIKMTYSVFGDNAFRRFRAGNTYDPNGAWESSRLNVALWDTLLYTFSAFSLDEITAIASHVREEFLDMMTYDTKFTDYISSTTDKPERIQYRAETWRSRLQQLVDQNARDPLDFSAEFKKSLFERNATCNVCWKPITTLDDAVLARFPNYWRENNSIPENARLDHRFCHKSR
ncbi:MAG: hypothetical protein AAFW84_22835, partial [Cyanobacteria bacterium J06635_15]